MFNRRRAIGLDIGPAAVRALVLEGRPGKVSIAATAAVPVAAGNGNGATVEAIHACLARVRADGQPVVVAVGGPDGDRSEEHTSELQSHHDLVCRLLLEKKKAAGINRVTPPPPRVRTTN